MSDSEAKSLEMEFAAKWLTMKEPMRPSAEVRAVYDEWVGNTKAEHPDPEVLILGSTAELRDIVLAHGIRPVCVDRSRRIWEAMKGSMSRQGEEAFIEADWLTMPEDQQYDLVLGDGSMVMLQQEQVEPFVRRVYALLKKDGVTVQRVGARTRSIPVEAFVDAVAQYRRGDYGVSLYQYVVFLFGHLASEFYPGWSSREIFEKALSPHLSDADIAELDRDLLDQHAYYPEKAWLDGLLATWFETLHLLKGTVPGCWDLEFTYVLRKRRVG
jgi:hypothetical protein